jgi:ribose transport system substrate-binding protein
MNRSTIKITTLVTTCIAVTALAACSSTSGSAPGGSAGATAPSPGTTTTANGAAPSSVAGKTICFVALANSHPYETPFNAEFAKQAAAANVKLIKLSQEFNPQTGSDEIKTCIARKPDAIVVNGGDPTAYTTSLAAAKQAGIPTNVVDGPLDDNAYPLIGAWTGPNSYEEGQVAGKAMDAKMNKQGTIVILEGTAGSKVTTDRYNGFIDQLKTDGSKIQVLGKAFTDFDQQKALVASRDLITKFGKSIQGMYASDDPTASGFLQAWQESGVTSTPIVIGMGGTTQAFQAIKAGKQYGTVYQSPEVDADLAFGVIAQVLAGSKVNPRQYQPTPFVTIANLAQFTPAF